MIVTRERCQICGNVADFLISDDSVLLREAKCEHCGASLRNSDVAGEIIKYISGKDIGLKNQLERIANYKILNACSSGYIHNALKQMDSYICSEFFDDVETGDYYDGVLCVDLCNIPFDDNTFDIVITEDIFEHIVGYDKAMREVCRVLKTGGCHIFTVPLHDGHKTVSRQGKKAVYHGDPIHADDGCLVITDWGNDIQEIVEKYGYRVEIVRKHDFYEPDEVTVVDDSYNEYLAKRGCLEKYLRYNSTVIVAYKENTECNNSPNKKIFNVGDAQDKYKKLNNTIVSLNRNIRNKNDIIRELNDDNEQRGVLITELNAEIEEKGLLINKLQSENCERNEHITRLDSEIEKKDERIQELQEENFDRNKHIAHLDSIIEQNEHTIEKQKYMGEVQLDQIMKQSELLVQQTNRIMEQAGHLGDDAMKIEELSRTVKRQTETIDDYARNEENYEQKIAELLQAADEKQRAYEQKIQSADEKVQEYEHKLTAMLQEDADRRQVYEQEKADLKQTILNKEGHIEQLLEVERAYERDKKSHSYRMGKRMQKVGDFFLPPNSRRRFFLRISFNVFRHPVLMLHVINPKRIKNYIKYMKLEGMEGVKKRYEEALDIERMQISPDAGIKLDLEDVEETQKGVQQRPEEFEKLRFPQVVSPKVSIIIPVYNEFHYTYNCLKSILRNSGEVTYEIIIANDCSTDLTTDIEKIVENITVITTDKNVRFLLNCNNAANYAKGEYILFLNNDTQVQDNWLEPLVDLIESNDKIGMVGSKLVYPDGKLQEAGGILWKDGSAWNYGNRRNPEAPEFNYVKEADYISGAAIMIKRKLWNEIGGFDKQFAPAYYEDTDLAFEVRKHGYLVKYQPLSVIVHFEGISNGTDVDSGQKHYQKVNAQKFYDKWKDILQSEHEDNGINVFTAKDRSIRKKHILVVDHYVPHHDQDAGGKCTYMYLKLFVKMGLKVTFIGDNFYRHEPYTMELNQMGIEVLYGNYYYNNWQEWLRENCHYFDYIYLQRPHIAVKYIDLVKQYSKAKILYFAHDLHHIREYREYEMTKDPKKLASSENWKKIEYDLFEKADVGHVVGTYEQEIMQKAFPNKPIRNIPLYIYDDLLSDINKDFSNRHDILYVGGFGHPPNIDAVLWFAKEVFPLIVQKHSDIKWHIVGGKVTKEIEQLASQNIIIEGFVSDEYLENLYRTCRMAVVPLRFGAGVKGKVVEAGYFQIPLVTTSIGAEGLNIEDGSMAVEDDGNGMADLICSIYQDFPKLKQMSDNGKKFIRKNFLLSEAERVIKLDMDI